MRMNVRNEKPPMWHAIDNAFNIGDRPIIFAWGTTIYNPNNGKVTRELMEHEEVHGARQLSYGSDTPGERIVKWWERYIADPEFRLAEEIPAHRIEYQAFCRRHGDRNARAKYLAMLAGRMSGQLYGGVITAIQARERILLG